MEKNDIKLPIKDRNILRDEHISTPPTPEGVWKDKGRDHPFFQEKVSLAAQLGGVSSTAGCPTIAAETGKTSC